MGTYIQFGYAWWLVLIYQVFSHGLFVLFPKHVSQRFTNIPVFRSYNTASFYLYYAFLLFVCFLPISSQPVFLIPGFVLYILFLSLFIFSVFYFAINEIHLPVVSGVYKYSRNPVYVGTYGIMFSFILATEYFFLLLPWAVYLYLNHQVILAEERKLFAQFGKNYQVYFRKTPRYFFFK